jgi:hypothetical protein
MSGDDRKMAGGSGNWSNLGLQLDGNGRKLRSYPAVASGETLRCR